MSNFKINNLCLQAEHYYNLIVKELGQPCSIQSDANIANYNETYYAILSELTKLNIGGVSINGIFRVLE